MDNKLIYQKLTRPKYYTLRTTITLSQTEVNHVALINLLNKSTNKAQLIRTLMLRGLAEYVKDEIKYEAQ